MGENLTEAEIAARIDVALSRIPKLQRKVFLAIRVDDLSYSEISERTGLSVEEVERHFAASLVRLDDAVEGRTPATWRQRLLRWITGNWR